MFTVFSPILCNPCLQLLHRGTKRNFLHKAINIWAPSTRQRTRLLWLEISKYQYLGRHSINLSLPMIFLTFTWQPRRLESALQGVNVQVGAVAGGSGGGAARHGEAGGAGQLASRARAGAKTTAGWLGILGGAAHNNGKLWHKSQAILHCWKVHIAWFWPTTFVL